jgi:hypothetical protein
VYVNIFGNKGIKRMNDYLSISQLCTKYNGFIILSACYYNLDEVYRFLNNYHFLFNCSYDLKQKCFHRIEFINDYIETLLNHIPNYFEIRSMQIEELRNLIEYTNQRIESPEEYISKNKERKYSIDDVYSKRSNGYNIKACVFFDYINDKFQHEIKHMLNGGERIIKTQYTKYFVDGYSIKYNTVYEWNEEHHYNKKQRIKDDIRKNIIIKQIKCNFIILRQKDILKLNWEKIKNISPINGEIIFEE